MPQVECMISRLKNVLYCFSGRDTQNKHMAPMMIIVKTITCKTHVIKHLRQDKKKNPFFLTSIHYFARSRFLLLVQYPGKHNKPYYHQESLRTLHYLCEVLSPQTKFHLRSTFVTCRIKLANVNYRLASLIFTRICFGVVKRWNHWQQSPFPLTVRLEGEDI